MEEINNNNHQLILEEKRYMKNLKENITT